MMKGHLANDNDEGGVERQRCSETKSQEAKPASDFISLSSSSIYPLVTHPDVMQQRNDDADDDLSEEDCQEDEVVFDAALSIDSNGDYFVGDKSSCWRCDDDDDVKFKMSQIRFWVFLDYCY